MKKFVFLSILLAGLSLTGCKVQSVSRTEASNILFNNAMRAMERQDFVLEANTIMFRRGNQAFVNANTNFVSLSRGRATIQLAFNSPHAGPNGIGGITVEGRASNIRMEQDRRGNISFSMHVSGVGVSATVFISMPNGTNRCTATVTPTFRGNRIKFIGNLLPRSQSNVFRGRAL